MWSVQSLDCLQLLWSSAIPCLDGQVQLANGFNRFSGRVEKCVNQEWGTVCADGFDDAAARQACRMAGLDSEGENGPTLGEFSLQSISTYMYTYL